MASQLGRRALYAIILVVLVGCGDQSLFMSLKGDTSDLQITSVTDGQLLAPGKSIPLTVSAQDPTKSTDVEIEVTLTSSSGESVWHNRSAVTLNTDSGIQLPSNLAPDLYKLDLVLYSAGAVVQKKTSSFFVAQDGWKITGIKSFPLVITTAARVMLQAEMEVPTNANPYLRWSWKGKTIAHGTLNDGYGQILWMAPSDVGVYTITLELFPSSPAAGTDFPFASQISLSTDIFVSGGTAVGSADLGADASYLTLLRLQASLGDTGTGSRVTGQDQALAIGSPTIVTLENGFGYRLDGKNGIKIPWLALPAAGGSATPFTLSIGVSFDDVTKAQSIVKAVSTNGDFLLNLALDPTASKPVARLTTSTGATVNIPWSGPALSSKQRYQLSLSVVPQANAVLAQWFLDGIQLSSVNVPAAVPSLTQDGSITIGGAAGFAGVVDEFGIYTKDEAGRPSSDPDLFARAQKRVYGSNLVLADGFDAPFLSAGYAFDGSAGIDSGVVRLAAGSAMSLPSIKIDGSGISLSAELSPDSSQTASLSFQWEGSATTALETSLDATVKGLKLHIAADGSSVVVTSPTGEKTLTLKKPDVEGADLRVKIGAPAAAGSPLILANLLAVKDEN